MNAVVNAKASESNANPSAITPWMSINLFTQSNQSDPTCHNATRKRLPVLQNFNGIFLQS